MVLGADFVFVIGAYIVFIFSWLLVKKINFLIFSEKTVGQVTSTRKSSWVDSEGFRSSGAQLLTVKYEVESVSYTVTFMDKYNDGVSVGSSVGVVYSKRNPAIAYFDSYFDLFVKDITLFFIGIVLVSANYESGVGLFTDFLQSFNDL